MRINSFYTHFARVCERETWCSVNEHEVQMWDKRVLKKIYRAKLDEVSMQNSVVICRG
jgi:endonuclease III